MMKKRTVHRIANSVGYLLVCLTIMAFVMRAMVPVGFMPDPAALRDGRIQVVFCSADTAVSQLSLDLAGHHKPSPDHHSGALGCPFGMLAAQAMGTPSSASALQPPATVSFPVALLAASIAAIPKLVQGPPLGSRAPPHQVA